MKKSTKILLGTVLSVAASAGVYYLIKKTGIYTGNAVEEFIETITEVAEPVAGTVSELSK